MAFVRFRACANLTELEDGEYRDLRSILTGEDGSRESARDYSDARAGRKANTAAKTAKAREAERKSRKKPSDAKDRMLEAGAAAPRDATLSLTVRATAPTKSSASHPARRWNRRCRTMPARGIRRGPGGPVQSQLDKGAKMAKSNL
ncbi:hypothetical protein [Methylocella silvestris]|uniref:hypothetical protein n=1 Tax=Methylocella silvestris TaxID=199596 RepID=UPI00059BB03D|nr:hypothetical protein [Methylocella silvestris]